MTENIKTAFDIYQGALFLLGQFQLARSFDDDFATHQLKLDILQLRLARWGETDQFAALEKLEQNQDTLSTANQVLDIVEGIRDRLEQTKRATDAVLAPEKQKPEDVVNLATDLPNDLQKIRSRFMQCLRSRKAHARHITESVKWAFYKKEKFNKFTSNITQLMDDLEKTLSDVDHAKLQQLSITECTGLNKSNLEVIQDIIEECDPWLREAVKGALEPPQAGTIINQSHNQGFTVGVHNGDNNGLSFGERSRVTNNFSKGTSGNGNKALTDL